MHRNLFDCVNIDPAKTNLPDGTNPDAADACAKYNAIIHSVGGINLEVLICSFWGSDIMDILDLMSRARLLSWRPIAWT